MSNFHLASVDIGSHSTLLLLADWVDHQGAPRLEPKIQRAEVVRLGEDLHEHGEISEARLIELGSVLLRYRQTLHALGGQLIRVVMTEAVRKASNAQAVFDLVKKILWVDPEILSGEAEATYAWRAVSHWHGDSLLTVDIGGGSTELCNGKSSLSIPIGALRLQKEMGVIPGPDYKKWSKATFAELNLKPFAKQPLIFVGGTAVALAMLHRKDTQFDWRSLEGLDMKPEDLDRVIQRLCDLSKELRAHLPGLEHGRSEVIICGLFWMRSLIEKLKVEDFRISTLGIRFGVLLDTPPNC